MRMVRPALVLALMSFGATGCGRAPEDDASRDTAQRVVDSASGDVATLRNAGPTLPHAGVAIHDAGNRWCVALAADSVAPRETVTIVFPDSTSSLLSVATRAVRRATPCATAFPQLQLAEEAIYDLTIIDTTSTRDAAAVALAVVSSARWTRGPDGIARADLDGDGIPEEARVCRADEGEYFTLWRRSAPDSTVRSVWGRYFDWGALVDADCAPGEGEEALSYVPPPDDAVLAARAVDG